MMSQNKKENSSKKIGLKFAAFLIGCMIVGLLCGVVTHLLSEAGITYVGNLENITIASNIIFAVVNIILFTLSITCYTKCKKAVFSWDGKDEEQLDKIEYKLNYPMLYCTISMVVGMLLYSVSLLSSQKADISLEKSMIHLIIAMGIFMLDLVWIAVVNSAVINLIKKINPEKRGSFFDLDFKKRWENSSDEAQKLIIYKSGYKAYSATTMTCMILWIVSLMGMLAFDTGILPVIFVCIIFLVQTVTYTLSTMKEEKR